LNIREDEVNRLSSKVKQLQQEIRELNAKVEEDEKRVISAVLFIDYS